MASDLKSQIRNKIIALGLGYFPEAVVREVLHRTGLKKDLLLQLRSDISGVLEASEDLLATIDTPDVREGPVLIWSMRGSLRTTSIEALAASALRLRGINVRMVVCDGSLPACDERSVFLCPDGQPTPGGDKYQCGRCQSEWRRLLEAFRQPYVSLSQLSNKEDWAWAEEQASQVPWKELPTYRLGGTPIGDMVVSSVIRFYLRASVDWADPGVQQMARRFLITAHLIYRSAERALDFWAPRGLLTSHGVYSIWGPPAELAKQRGLPLVVWANGYRQGTLLFAKGGTYFDQGRRESTETGVWESLDLTEDQQSDLDSYLADRGAYDAFTYYQEQVNLGEITSRLDLDPSKPVLALFSNVLWDAQVSYRNTFFPSVLDWLWTTIEAFRDTPGLQLVVRPHPLETKLATFGQEHVENLIRQRYPQLPGNIHVIPADSPISSYSVARIARAATVYGTQMGLELAVMGMPVIVAGASYYRGKGFTYDPESVSEYLGLVGRFATLPLLDDLQKERARKYAYYIYFQTQVPFDAAVLRGRSDIERLSITSLHDLLPGRRPGIDQLVDSILAGAPTP